MKGATMPKPIDSAKSLSGELLLMLAGLAALGSLATNIILPAFPSMGAELGTSVKDLSATLSTFFVAFALGQLFVGPLSDRFGRALVISGLCVFVVGSAVCAFATSLPQLIVGRVIQALGVCATSVLSRAIARDLFEGDALARALSLVMVAMAAAPGFLRYWAVSSTVFGWRATFGVVGVLAILLGIHYVSRLGETHSSDLRRPLALSAVAATYKALLTDRRFITSTICQLGLGLAVSVFCNGTGHLDGRVWFFALATRTFFASTVFVVFGAGLLAPRLAHRFGTLRAARAGIFIAFAAGATLLAAPEQVYYFSAALTVFLIGMGLINPLGTAVTLQPLGKTLGQPLPCWASCKWAVLLSPLQLPPHCRFLPTWHSAPSSPPAC
jgi:DHA1 family bicyclomycin/chloramphenicol resistance-like MFS transporter